jgi:Protein of unknown function (DUF3024)
MSCAVKPKPRIAQTHPPPPSHFRVAIPEAIVREVTRELDAFCEGRIPAELRDQIRLEYSVRGNAITIVERRPPWREDFGPDWSSVKVAQLRFEPAASAWALYCSDANDRWHRYSDAQPTNDLGPLLDEIDSDPTGIFWG